RSQKGWVNGHAPGREDRKPSFGFNPATGHFNDFGRPTPGDDNSLLDAMALYRPDLYPTWRAARDDLACRLGLAVAILPRTHATNSPSSAGATPAQAEDRPPAGWEELAPFPDWGDPECPHASAEPEEKNVHPWATLPSTDCQRWDCPHCYFWCHEK